jgi:hypothetical protein
VFRFQDRLGDDIDRIEHLTFSDEDAARSWQQALAADPGQWEDMSHWS